MAVSVMHVRHVLVGMAQARMAMSMRVRLTGRVERAVLMLVVLVMNMRVAVHRFLVRMLVDMAFGQMEIDSDRHQRSRDDELRA